MAGIMSFGVYVPLHRLARSEIVRSWGQGAASGERAVASHDEDAITMAVAASIDALTGIDRKTIDAVYFASTTSPFKEKQCAVVIAAALGLRSDISTADFSQSLRAGTSALKSAIDSISAGSARKVLVCGADMRCGAPRSEKEMSFGDGGAAILLGKENTAADFVDGYSVAEEIYDVWRSDKDTYVRSWEDRFVREEGYGRVVARSVNAALQRFGVTAKHFAKVAVAAPNSRELSTVAKELGFDAKTQVQDLFHDQMGNTGAALSLMIAAAALEDLKPGSNLLLASYGDGCDVLIFRAKDHLAERQNRRGIKDYLASKRMVSTYLKYLDWREVVPVDPPARPSMEQHSPVALRRDSRGMALQGVKCRHCGAPQYPAPRVCAMCQTKDQFDEYSFADKSGHLFTFSNDSLAPNPDPPTTLAVVDFEGGGRITCDMTDRNPDEIVIGMPVEMTFRRIRYVGGVYNYWWKCRPVRGPIVKKGA